MFTGISGLLSHGEKMSVIGNNIANVNTVGFKGSRMDFEDLFYQSIGTAGGTAQVGQGVRVGTVLSDFSQGSFEQTNESTDLAIAGNGFFTVKTKGQEEFLYTRAGNFRFDDDGFLVDPHNKVLQGFEILNTNNSNTLSSVQSAITSSQGPTTVGFFKDIQLENFQIEPQRTKNISIINQLDSGAASRSESLTNPFFSMFENWDGQDTVNGPLAETAYSYQTSIKVFDENGSAHNVTVYFDQVDLSNAGGQKVWEYTVTTDPAEDNRFFIASDGSRVEMRDTSAAGVMMIGTMTFNAAGDITDQSAFTLSSGSVLAPGGLKDLDNWSLAEFSTNGYPAFNANFLGTSGASFRQEPNYETTLTELNFGIINQNFTEEVPGNGFNGWDLENNPVTGTPITTAGDLSGLAASGGTVDVLPGFLESEVAALSTSSFSAGSSTLFIGQDGFTHGFLMETEVDEDGILTGRFSNGEVQQLYQLALGNFLNNHGLRREGSNYFSETRESGPALVGRANEGTLGAVISNSLEQSNVDLAKEFVTMITTQRGFSANSKTITTADQMLMEVIQLKR
jgi:flagellar hook protein FlgE